jgi:hypothetical protein
MSSPRDADRVEIVYEPGISASWGVRIDRFLPTGIPVESTRHGVDTTLAIEQLIAAVVADCGPEVARAVYFFGGRDIHLRDGSRVECRWQLVVSDWRCLDCGVDTNALDEYYLLHDDLWEQLHPDKDGNLCIGCVEQRLGRHLNASDFTDLPINNSELFTRSVRLRDRLA